MNLIGTYDALAEQSVLGAVFLDPNVLDEISFLEDRDFLDSRHQQIYRVMRWLDEKSRPIDLVTVTELYVQHNRADQVSVTYLTDLASNTPTTANVTYYANIVRSKAIRRRGSEIGQQILDMARDDFETDEEYFSEMESLVSSIRPDEEGKMQSLQETRKSYFDHLLTKAVFIETGFYKFDQWSNGLAAGDLFISAGRPSVGKTALLLQRAMGVAESGSGPVLLYSQEMDENQLKDRMVASISNVPYNSIHKKDLSPRQLGSVEEAYNQIEKLPIYIQDSSGITIDEIRATARRFKRRYGRVAMIAVDYLQIMKIPQKKNENRSQAIGRVTGEAKSIAREMKCCFMMLSQMSRESENKKKPQLSDLRESGSIEQDADIVEFLWHDTNDFHDKGKVVQQFIAKGRNIGMNEFRLLFRGWKMHFEELE